MGNSIFKGGKISIELNDNIDTFLPGQIINGQVIVEQEQPFAASKLMLSFIGSEHSFFDESNDKSKSHYRQDNIVTRLDYDLIDLGPYQNQCQIGKF